MEFDGQDTRRTRSGRGVRGESPGETVTTKVGVAFAALVVALALCFGFYTASYFLTMHEDEKCFGVPSLGSLDRAAVERCLFLYGESPCRPEDRIRGVDYTRGVCVSYDVLGLDPIHVIYDKHGRVLNKISAYE